MSIFTENKTKLEKHGYTVIDDNTVVGSNGQPIAGMDAYGQVWYKEQAVETLCSSPVVEETELVRARNNKGHYIKDDPSTPENEAWTTKKEDK
jgi:hypothetical protein|tara:strand:+ start:3199 stop:3477 length:279 start_codon:yes stop_codon:yes gene_type:complete